jgi:hypothetical protein
MNRKLQGRERDSVRGTMQKDKKDLLRKRIENFTITYA